MYFDLFLISVLMVTVYLGPMIVRRHPPGERGFGWLLLADGAIAGVALAGRHSGGGQGADLLGFVAIAAGVFLLVIPPMLRDLTQRAMVRGRLRLARRLLGLRELLQPGMGAERERELLDSIVAVRSGQVDEAVSALAETREGLDDEHQRRNVDERILLTYLSARRWRDAIEVYEREFHGDSLSPQLVVEVVRAYCEVGDLDGATELMSALENSPLAKEPMATLLIGRARLVFLSFAGRIRDVDKLIAPGGPLHSIPKASRHFWSGIARLNAGDRPGARAALEVAHEYARRDPQAHAYTAAILDSIDEPGVAGPRALPTAVSELADLLAERAAHMKPPPRRRVPQMSGVRVGKVPVTAAMVAGNLLAFALVLWQYGSTGDPGALVHAGANMKSAVAAGEWWRLCTCMFLHVGFVHLLLNVYGLWILGKLVEQIHGSFRMFAIYMCTGIGGSVASLVFGGPTMSVGASGAVLGLLGALIAELTLARSSYPEKWRKMLLGNLIFIALSMVGIGFLYQTIDQSAHLGGMLSGAVIAALISPRSPLSKSNLMRLLSSALVVFSATVAMYGVIGVASNDYSDTMARLGQVEHRSGTGLAFVGPATWERDGEVLGRLDDPYVGTVVLIGVEQRAPRDLGEQLDIMRANAEQTQSNTERRPAHERLALPDPWQSRELIRRDDGMGGEFVLRMIFFGRVVGDELWLGTVMIPDKLADDMLPTIEQMLSSMRRI